MLSLINTFVNNNNSLVFNDAKYNKLVKDLLLYLEEDNNNSGLISSISRRPNKLIYKDSYNKKVWSHIQKLLWLAVEYIKKNPTEYRELI